jgi:predicted regulator of Ras-like GTPase activity (Roadblock/LC7/MglB family)
MLRERLKEIASRLDGVCAMALVGPDGIPVETLVSDPRLDTEMLCAELVALVRAMEENHRELAIGTLRGLDIAAERYRVSIYGVGGGFCLLLAMPAEQPIGRARFELRRSSLSLAEDLA